MTEAMLERILGEANASAPAKGKDADEERTLGDGRKLTLHLAHDGAAMSVARIEAVRIAPGGVLVARNDKGERFFVALDDVYAIALDAGTSTGSATRKAGFLG
jgi:hypothetical protein